jgi:thimet oligopeptidase
MAKVSRFIYGVAVLLLVVTAGGQEIPDQAPLWSTKPDVAAFEKMENSRLTAAQAAADQVVAAKAPRTIENTLAPYDEAVRQLNAAAYFSGLMQQVHPDAAFRDHATAMTTKVSSAQTALSLNREVYQALSNLNLQGADAATRYYVQRQLLEFRLAGVDKDDGTRMRLKKLNQQLTEDQSMFDRNISDDTRSVELADASALDGLPQDFIDQHKAGPDGKIHILANEPNVYPIMTFAKSDDLRHRMWEAFCTRAYPKKPGGAPRFDADTG